MLLAYKIMVTVFNVTFISLVLWADKDECDRAVNIISFLVVVLMMMNTGLVWN